MNALNFNDLHTYLVAQRGNIIHQIWFGTMPNKRAAQKTYKKFKIYRDSWSIKNPTWRRMEWDKKLCETFVFALFPEHYELYINYEYDIQRCDAVRYMILWQYGGLYADMDYYCNKTFSDVFDKYQDSLYLVQTPNRQGDYVSNSLMFSVPRHPFWKCLLIEMEVSKNSPIYYSKHLVVMFTTGPGIVNRVYHKYKHRYKLKSWPHKYFQPHTHTEHVMTLKNDKAYAIHMSGGCWHGSDSGFIVIFCTDWKFILFVILILLLPLLIYRFVK